MSLSCILQVDPGSIRERPGSLDRDTGSNVTTELRQQREATSLGSWDTAWQTLPLSLRREQGPANTSPFRRGLQTGCEFPWSPTPPRVCGTVTVATTVTGNRCSCTASLFPKGPSAPPTETTPPHLGTLTSMAGTRTPWLLLGSGSPVLGAPPRDSPLARHAGPPSGTLTGGWEMGLISRKARESAPRLQAHSQAQYMLMHTHTQRHVRHTCVHILTCTHWSRSSKSRLRSQAVS